MRLIHVFMLMFTILLMGACSQPPQTEATKERPDYQPLDIIAGTLPDIAEADAVIASAMKPYQE